jgi:two-component system response regulator HydG
MRRLHSLKAKLFLGIALVVVVSGLAISVLVTYRYGRTLYASAIGHAEDLSHQIVLQAADKVLLNDLVALQKLIGHHMRSHASLSYMFIVRDGEVMAHSFEGGFPVGLLTAAKAGRDANGGIVRITSETGEDYLDLSHPILEGRAGVLRVGLSETPLSEQVVRLWLQMMALTAGVLCVGLLVGHLFIRRITGPLSTLAKAAEEISGGRLDVHVAAAGNDEVGRLSAAFNAMIARLQDRTLQLESQALQIERAYQQTRNSFAIVQEIGSRLTLSDACSYLIRRFQGVVSCRRMAMLIFLENRQRLFTVSEGRAELLTADAYEPARSVVSGIQATAFFKIDILPAPVLPGSFGLAQRLVIIPVRHEEALLGALVIACNGHCACDRKGLDVIELIFREVSGTLRRAALQEEGIRSLQERVEHSEEFNGIVGKAAQMRSIFKLIEDTAPTDATVLIQGESGTGKELAAKAIHSLSQRREKPFVVINCSAFPATLLESELFGHEKGAFTGAIRQKPGRFEQADGGTVFLDEIGEIPPSAQIRLLRVLQTQKFERLGGERTVAVNVRIIAATNRDLLDEVRKGNFREDLYYRLNVIPIQMPPLRARTNDIPLLARVFLRRFSQAQGKETRDFSTEAMRRLLEYAWPGNVRELENTVEHAVVLCKGDEIEVADLPAAVQTAGTSPGAAPRNTLVDNEKQHLRDILIECGWNKKLAAKRLGISRSTLYEKLRKYEIVQPTLH